MLLSRIKEIKTKITIAAGVITALTFLAVILAPVPGYASRHDGPKAQPTQGLCAGAKNLRLTDTARPGGSGRAATDPCEDTDNANADGLNDLIATLINIFSIIIGIIAVIMILIGGLKFITSSGDSNKITSAKQTIIYAVIGLIIVALAQFFVRFILSKATGTVSD